MPEGESPVGASRLLLVIADLDIVCLLDALFNQCIYIHICFCLLYILDVRTGARMLWCEYGAAVLVWLDGCFKSTDAAGNISTITAYLTVSNITTDTLNSLADGVLAYIVNDDMTQREKAWAIYTWCVNNIRYSTRTSYLGRGL